MNAVTRLPPGEARLRRQPEALSPLIWAIGGASYLAALLAVDHYSSFHEQLGLGALTWVMLLAALSQFPALRRAQALGVVLFATVGEVTGAILWGVYHYRLHNLPMFIPPAHGIVYLTGLSLSVALRRHTRALVLLAALAATTWGLVGLTVLPRRDVAGAIGVPLLLLFLWRSHSRAVYAGVFLVVGALELYGTAIGTWHWAPKLPGLGIPDGNPPSGVASGYVWFDVMGMLVAPWLMQLVSVRASRRRSADEQTLPRSTPA
ncbi:MAG TPA: hypothetical protein VG652_04445 [Gaiellaceae bacterium]|nr:hypothetical protein [Gaiellaceae bacterium]